VRDNAPRRRQRHHSLRYHGRLAHFNGDIVNASTTATWLTRDNSKTVPVQEDGAKLRDASYRYVTSRRLSAGRLTSKWLWPGDIQQHHIRALQQGGVWMQEQSAPNCLTRGDIGYRVPGALHLQYAKRPTGPHYGQSYPRIPAANGVVRGQSRSSASPVKRMPQSAPATVESAGNSTRPVRWQDSETASGRRMRL
jgi:hypothetical protein